MNRTILGLVLVCAALPVSAARDPGLDEIEPSAIEAVQAACRETPFSMLVTIRNIKDTRGIITLDLQSDDAAIWLKKGSKLGRFRARPQKGQIEVCIPVEKLGNYAVVLYQDRNINFELNKNFLGLPSEPYGVSNDPAMNFGPPNMKDSLVAVRGPRTPVRVTLHN